MKKYKESKKITKIKNKIYDTIYRSTTKEDSIIITDILDSILNEIEGKHDLGIIVKRINKELEGLPF